MYRRGRKVITIVVVVVVVVVVVIIIIIMFFLLQLWLTDLEIFAALFAALIHDYEHTGTTNTFHINTGYVGPTLYDSFA